MQKMSAERLMTPVLVPARDGPVTFVSLLADLSSA
jgi:hypothetical protein